MGTNECKNLIFDLDWISTQKVFEKIFFFNSHQPIFNKIKMLFNFYMT